MTDKKLDEFELDACVLVQKHMVNLRDKGVVAIWPWTESDAVQLTRKCFFATFDKFAVQSYPTEGGKGYRAFTDYNGVRFFTLLDNEMEVNDV